MALLYFVQSCKFDKILYYDKGKLLVDNTDLTKRIIVIYLHYKFTLYQNIIKHTEYRYNNQKQTTHNT